MPSLQTVDLSPIPRTQATPLEQTLSTFTKKYGENQTEKRETDALREIYDQYKQDGLNINNAFIDIQTKPGLSPTTRVNSVNQLLNLQKTNSQLQANAAKKVKAEQQVQDAAEKKNKEETAESEKKRLNLEKIDYIEKQRALEKGELAAFADDPAMAERITKPRPLGKPTQASQPIDEDQLRRIREVRANPEFEKASGPKKYQLLTDAGVSKENAKAEVDVYTEDEKLKNEQLNTQNKTVESAYKAQEKFIDSTTSSYRAFETDTKPKLLQMQKLTSDDNLIEPTTAVFLENLGIPLGAIDNPDSELFHKLSLDLLKGLPETYGNRILKVEVDNFLRTIPALTNSAAGRRMIASNMLKLGEMKEIYYNEMRKQQRDSLDNNKPLPRDFQQKVFEQVQPQINRINNEFVKLSEIKEVPPNTIPFFDPDGQIVFVPKELSDTASQKGGRRIW